MTIIAAPIISLTPPETAATSHNICSREATKEQRKIVLDLSETKDPVSHRMRQLSVGSQITASLTVDDDDDNSSEDTMLFDDEEEPVEENAPVAEKGNPHKHDAHLIETESDPTSDPTTPKDLVPPPRIVSTTTPAATKRPSIKRYDPAEIPIEEKKSSWKNLPKPDLGIIRAQTAPAVLVADEERREAMKTGVRFHQVVIREYDQTLGDNPSVSYGPPISLDWEYSQLPELDLDLYESHRGKRRGMRQMMMNYYQRRNLLSWRYGITEEQLKQAERDANKIKRGRSLTKAFLPAQKLEEMVQSVTRKTKRMSNKNKSMEEVCA